MCMLADGTALSKVMTEVEGRGRGEEGDGDEKKRNHWLKGEKELGVQGNPMW